MERGVLPSYWTKGIGIYIAKKTIPNIRNVFSFTPSIPEHVYWDDYYNKKFLPNTELANGRASMFYSNTRHGLGLSGCCWCYCLTACLSASKTADCRTIPNTNTTPSLLLKRSAVCTCRKDNRIFTINSITYFLEHIRRTQRILKRSQQRRTDSTSVKSNTKEGTKKIIWIDRRYSANNGSKRPVPKRYWTGR